MSDQIKITCSGCSLLCDDIIIIKHEKDIEKILGTCLKGKEKFNQIISKNRILNPLIRKNNSLEKINWDIALDKAVQMINNSIKPVLYGLSNISCEAQLNAIKIARKINGFIDSNSTICQGQVLNFASKIGITTMTLTDIINKSDVIILWGVNVVESIPRLLSKILFSRGKFRITGREIKSLIIVDIYKTASFNVLGTRDLALIIKPDNDIELIRFLKKYCREEYKIPAGGNSGIDKQDLERLISILLNSEHISILTGQALIKPQGEGHPMKELLELIKILNKYKKIGRVSLMMVGGHYNMVGFEHIALAETGKNQSIQFRNGKSVQTEETIISKLQNQDFDLSIIVGTDPISHFPAAISKNLSSKPMILIDNKKSGTYLIADLILPTAITGIECEGLAFRLDHVPIKLKKIIDPPNNILSDAKLLENILMKLE
ncbi:MAG: formylmethanofuran dehydrogenase subunit B [Candidatus Lokiarchaeota archaeon]|nr:formylmethanofuran dehydrogenase subunit B [Candidatus Lokiarchaeota archaeon]